MLVLTRRPGEQIIIANGIRVTVVSIGLGRVKIGIEAPPHVRIDRQEIHEKIQQEKATDVLASVGEAQSNEVSPTAVVGGDTDLKLHNRIADKLPTTTEPPASQGGTDTPRPDRLSRYRLPRKPR